MACLIDIYLATRPSTNLLLTTNPMYNINTPSEKYKNVYICIAIIIHRNL